MAHKVAPSIATNNKMVLKPSEKTPLTALVLADILYEAGLPPAMFSVVTGDPAEIGLELIANPNVEVVTFTGGVSVGKWIAANAGQMLTLVATSVMTPISTRQIAPRALAGVRPLASRLENNRSRKFTTTLLNHRTKG